MDPEPGAQAARYRRQAEHLRQAVQLIADERLREQLLSFAQQYEIAAAAIEQEIRLAAVTVEREVRTDPCSSPRLP
jgi:hypothetical protein